MASDTQTTERCPRLVLGCACGAVYCGGDHRPDNTGLDDGPYLPGRAPRKKAEAKSVAIVAEIKARAWATRRAKYGVHGHG